MTRPVGRLVLALLLAGSLARCAGTAPSRGADAAETAWVGTWGTAPQLVEPRNLPPPPGLAGTTLRQVVRVSIGGVRVRLHLSNQYGETPLVVEAAHVADAHGGSAIAPGTGQALTFGGRPSVTLPPGGTATSDPFAYALAPRSDVAITLRFGAVPEAVTGHPGARTTSYLAAGAPPSSLALPGAAEADRWYVVTGLDVEAPGGAAVVTLGDSITDGRGSGTNRHNRWPDELAGRLHGAPATRHVAVLNMGIGGNCVLAACLGPAAVQRFERDVLRQPGARWLIVLEGINDLGRAPDADVAAVADALVAAYTTLIERARARGLQVYGATLLPFGGSFYDTPAREAARQRVNAWIRTRGVFDAVIDLDAALRDPAAPTRLLPAYDTGDHLHPNEAGYRRIAEAIDLGLFGEG